MQANPSPSAIALSRLKAKPVVNTDVVLTSCVQNEALRLPWFLNYYRRLGIDRFLIVDHESNDATASFLDSQEDVLRFCASGSYSDSMHGIDWTNSVTSTYSPNCWVLTVDADEFLVYPNCEELQIRALASYLESRSATAMRAPLLDMYQEGALNNVRYEPGDDILAAFPYFDHVGYETETYENFDYIVQGGPRQRVFWDNAELPYPPPHLMKIPFVKWNRRFRYTHSTHKIFGRTVGEISGLLLHFKFTPQFYKRVSQEVERAEHFDGAREYKAYRAALERDPELLVIQNGSKRFENSRQLVELGLMRQPSDFMTNATDSLQQAETSHVPEFAEEAAGYFEPDFSGKQWREFEHFDEAWKARIGQMSNFIKHGASVLDLGCGPMWLKDIRPDLQYAGVDYCRRSDDSLIADFNRGEFPQTKSSYAFLSGILEYVQDVPWFIERVCTTSEVCILSYCLRGTHPDISARRQLGWVNDLTLNEIENLFAAHSFLLVAEDMTATRNKILVFARDDAKEQRLPAVVPSGEDAFPKSELERINQRKWVLGHAKKWGVGAELGVFRGHFSQLLARTALPKKLFLVDLWTKQGEWFDLGEIPVTNYNKLTTRQAMEDAMRRLEPFKRVFDIEFREETSLEFLDGLARNGTTLDYSYVDTCHQYDQILAELHGIDRVLAPHGVILGDNWHPSKHAAFHGVYRAVQEFCRNKDYQIVACGPALQWCVQRRLKY